MIPFYSYSPEDVDPVQGSSSNSNSYFHPTTHFSAHSYDGIPIAPTDPAVPSDLHTYSHSAPATPHPAFDPLRQHQFALPYATSSSYQPQYYRSSDNACGDSTLAGFDRAPAASSSTSSALGHSGEAATSFLAPCPLGPPVPLHHSPLNRQRRSIDDESESRPGADRKSRTHRERARRHGLSPTARPESRPTLSTRRSVPDAITEEPAVEKAEKSCKACRGRKVRCSRDWPKCSRCTDKSLDCSYGDLIPVSFLKNDKLEEKILSLEAELRLPRVPSTADFPSFLYKRVCECGLYETTSTIDELSAQDLTERAKAFIWSRLHELWMSEGYHPALLSFLSQRHTLVLDSLPPRDQVAVALCCSASLRSGAANVAFAGQTAGLDGLDNPLQARAIEIYDHHEVGYEDSTRAGLALHVLGARIFSWDVSTRKRSRGWLRIALSVYRDLIEGAEDFDAQVRLMREFGLTLLDLDSSLAADAPAFPLISNEDLLVYFSIFPRTTPTSSLSAELAPVLIDLPYERERTPQDVEPAISVIYRWVVLIERWVAEQLSPRGFQQPLSRSAIGSVFGQVEQVHSAIASVQNHLVSMRCTGGGDLHRRDHHLRFLSRLNYQVDEAVYRTYGLVKQRLALSNDGSLHDCNGETLRSIEERVVEAVKRAAFYLRVHAISSFPAECRHVVYSLDCFPTWIRFAVERSSSSPGRLHDSPRNNPNNVGPPGFQSTAMGVTLSSTELQWIDEALDGVAKFDSAVEEDLAELRELRVEREGAARDSRAGPQAVPSIGGLDFRQALLKVSNELAWI